MLPGDKKPWAKPVAILVIFLSVVISVIAVIYLNSIQMFHIPEAAIVILALLTILPPNIVIARGTTDSSEHATSDVLGHHVR